MEDKRLTFEHLMIKGFGCRERHEYFFADANFYDGAARHPETVCAYMVCALINLRDKLPHKKESIEKCLGYLTDAAQTQNPLSIINSMDKAPDFLSENGIVF